ncbi:response regulator transcription factor [Staphylospora marina]|uniref:response regulator transcription factor n=1 Tax=Staphylospora marina TaxID=2490858 RepID=UPI000F5B9501|nr:response regulator transcription factor [Staphylospora marina]
MSDVRILVVDDEREIVDLVRIVLEKEGFRQIGAAGSGGEAVRVARRFRPHLIILDVMLPDRSGFEVCREIRRFSDAPVLFLTARSADADKLTGFDAGGDDYVTKPFNPLELAARVKAMCRRLKLMEEAAAPAPVYDFGRFRVDVGAGQLWVDGREVACPAMEFKLLAFLCAHPDRVFSRGQLYEQVWGEESLGDENTVMVHVRRLREKIERDPGKPEFLVTVRGLGYKLTNPSRRAGS